LEWLTLGIPAAFLIQHPRVVLMLSIVAAVLPYLYWRRRWGLTRRDEREEDRRHQ